METNPEYRKVTNTLNPDKLVARIRTAQTAKPQPKHIVPPKK